MNISPVGEGRRSWRGPALVFALALGLRVWFVLAATVENALRRADAMDYLQYAFNLVLFHTFSKSHVADGPIVPDSFRDPGYPFFLACMLRLLGFTETWYLAVLLLQALLGALTAALSMLIARYWLPPRLSLLAGLLVALWPHNVVFSAYVLSETLSGFVLTLAVWLTCRALAGGARLRWAAAGAGFGLASLVNAAMTPAGPLLALLFWRRQATAPRLALILCLCSLVPPGVWAMRAWTIASERAPQGRALMNLVQGSWPEYHQAYAEARGQDPAAQDTMRAIGREQDLMLHSPQAGLASMWDRFGSDPARYLAWYAWKPMLLWGWSIRMGWGDIYAYPVSQSIYLSNPVMRAGEALCFALNPLLFLLMLAAMLAAVFRPAFAAGGPALLAVVTLAALETLVYSLLQSEPRYSIPLRPLEMVLAATALHGMLKLRATAAARV